MLIVPRIRLLFFALLAVFVPLADAKGGGGKGSGGRGISGSRFNAGSKITKTTVVVNGQSQDQCKNSETNLVVPCPKISKVAIVAISVICSVVGLVLILVVIYWIVRRRQRNKRAPSSEVTSQKREYKNLVEAEEKRGEV